MVDATGLSAIIEIAIPVFAIIALGYGLGRFGLISDGAAGALNGYVYYAAMPALFIQQIGGAPLSATFNPSFLAVIIGAQLIVLGGAMIAATKLFPGRLSEVGLHGLSTVFSNTGYIGIPLMQIAYGPEGAVLAILATIVNSVLFLGFGSAILAADAGDAPDSGGWTGAAGRASAGFLKSPLVAGAIIGAVISALSIPLPSPLTTTLDLLGRTAGPCALFAMGLFLVGREVTRGGGEVAWMALLKLIALPLVTWLVGLFVLPLSPLELAVAVVLAALPTGSLVFVISERAGIFVARSVAVILITTIASFATLSLLLSLFRV
ncbi:MAG: AEC family transporter [Alphaproteobacteria bacterium]|nr:AEC family transporter [Alphaproteobacteria bacterium]